MNNLDNFIPEEYETILDVVGDPDRARYMARNCVKLRDAAMQHYVRFPKSWPHYLSLFADDYDITHQRIISIQPSHLEEDPDGWGTLAERCANAAVRAEELVAAKLVMTTVSDPGTTMTDYPLSVPGVENALKHLPAQHDYGGNEVEHPVVTVLVVPQRLTEAVMVRDLYEDRHDVKLTVAMNPYLVQQEAHHSMWCLCAHPVSNNQFGELRITPGFPTIGHVEKNQDESLAGPVPFRIDTNHCVGSTPLNSSGLSVSIQKDTL